MARGRAIMPAHFPQRAGATAGPATPASMQPDLMSLPFHTAVSELEKRLIENALHLAQGNKTEAANRLQINRRLLYQKIDEHQIKE
jgi:two-component system NtrC family response regulator